MALDPVDVAYFTLGVGRFLSSAQGISDPDAWDGEINFVDAAVDLAKVLDVQSPEDGFGGVFAYEIAEPLGEWVAATLNEQGPTFIEKAIEETRAKMHELIAAMQ